MNALGLIGLVLLVLAAAVVALVARRQGQRNKAAATGPRTVADLVRLRAESGDSPLRPVTATAPDPVPSEAAPEPRAEAPAASSTAAPPVAAAPTDPVAPPDEPRSPAAEPEPVEEPRAEEARAEEASVEEVPAEKPRAPGPDIAGFDTPWHRAEVMAAGDGGAGTWEPPEAVDAVPVPVEPAPVEPAPVESVPGVPALPEPTQADPEPVADVPAPANPVPVALRLVPPVPEENPEADHSGTDADPEPDPNWTGWADWAEVDAEVDAEERARSTPAAGAENPAPESTAPLAPVPTPAPIPDTEPEAEPMVRPLGRRTPEERAAEQAAADLALLRTFGYGDPSTRPDSAPVVSMVRAGVEVTDVADDGAAQPVRFRVVRRDGSTVGGAAVTLLDDRGVHVADAAVDASGRGEVIALAAGGFMLVATAPGHQPGAVAVTVKDAPVDVDMLLVRSASVSGSVQGEDGPIAGARVTLVQDGEVVDAVTTDADGTYRIEGLGSGEYGLSVAAAGFVPAAGFVEVPDETDLLHDAVLASAAPTAASHDGYGDAGDGMMSGHRYS